MLMMMDDKKLLSLQLVTDKTYLPFYTFINFTPCILDQESPTRYAIASLVILRERSYLC